MLKHRTSQVVICFNGFCAGDSIDCDREVLEITSGGRPGRPGETVGGDGGASATTGDHDLTEFLDFEDCANEAGRLTFEFGALFSG